MNTIFDHEKLRVYKASIHFISTLDNILKNVPKKHAAYNQLDRASTSIALNIAEGNGKTIPHDRCKFFDISRGSALECAAALDVLVAKGVLREHEIVEGKEILQGIVSMLVGLTKKNVPDRICETEAEYGNYNDDERES